MSTPEAPTMEKQSPHTSTIDVLETRVDRLSIERAEPSAGVAVKTAENASLAALCTAYESDATDSDASDSKWKQIRRKIDFAGFSSSSDDDCHSDSDFEPMVKAVPNKGAVKKAHVQPKSAGEMDLDLLPPVPDLSALSLSAETDNIVHMGHVLGIVDKLVTVAALPNSPAYDLDTLLFLENGKVALGYVFDVLGQVSSPIYAIRFNSVDDIKAKNIEIGVNVYSAPTSKHTQYVFLQELLKLKGTDASWLDDNEVPAEFADYSDDESECFRRHGNRKMQAAMKRSHSVDKHAQFEQSMNKRNVFNTKLNRYIDSYKHKRNDNQHRGARPPPDFDPSVPPPNFVAPRHANMAATSSRADFSTFLGSNAPLV